MSESPQYQEIEVKLFAPDLDVVRERLVASGGRETSPRVYERNVRYEDAGGTLTGRRIVLRLRQDTRTRLTYKDGGAMVAGSDLYGRFEAEVEVSDFAAMETILAKLGYHPAMVYEKYRTTYDLGGAEVVLDELPYGNFVEIEGEAGAIQAALDRLGLRESPRFTLSYTAIFDNVRQQLKLPFTDLTFAHFAGVDADAVRRAIQAIEALG